MKLVVLLTVFALATADVYLHMPRGSNNRLNEASAERNNGNRLCDTQNNNRGGYNVGDKTKNAAPGNNPARNPSETYNFNDISTAMQYPFVYLEGSTLRTEWTSQHGCGGNEADDPHKMNCNMVIQYTCDTTSASIVAPSLEMEVRLRDGGNTGTPNEPNNYNDIASTRASNDANQNGRHESEAWYYMCKRRLRNHGLFHADQYLNGVTSKYTRQNNNGNRRGLECPEERDYYPYWNPSPWNDIAYLTSHPEHCPMILSSSQNNNSIGWCDGLLPTAGDNYDKAVPITEEECQARAAAGEPAVWRTMNKGLPPPDCLPAPWGRVNHLGNGRDGQHHHYDWKIPSFDLLTSRGYATVESNFLRCVFRLRYNISTDDYDPWTANSTMDDNEYLGVLSPIRQNPTVDIGAHDLTGLRLALNTNQFGRTFQDRSHIFYIMKRPVALAGVTGDIWNLNVRGKRGNIVQTYPSVEYDFVPTTLWLNPTDLIHVQWTGSNTHNNGNPAGDGQAGDAGEGTGGTDRHNWVQMGDLSENYPLPLDKFGDDDASIFKHSKCWTLAGTAISAWEDCALILATSGQYRTMGDVPTSATTFNPLLNDAPPSLIGGLILSLEPTSSGKTFNYMCTRNNNFSNRSQKGSIIVS